MSPARTPPEARAAGGRAAEAQPARTVRTVLGEVDPAELGICDAHDHLFLRSPMLPGQELADPDAAAGRLREFRALGGRAVVQWTPYGMGRRPAELAALSRAERVHVVAATGLHQAAHYDRATLRSAGEDPAELFVTEMTDGIAGTGVRAGLIKVAGAFHGIDAHARRTMGAAARAHHRTGAPIAVHLELGTGALDVLDLLCGELEVPPERVILGHLGRSPDQVIQRMAAESGAYLAFDGPSRAHHATDWRLPEQLAVLAVAGFGDRLLLGGDTTVPETPGMAYLLRRLRPRLEVTLGERMVERILVANPARALSFRAP
ncbi:phosphotriesterase [Streptomyces scopuliridis]|uniref:Phosphotriesterase n=1 Tax=Streptomyces scopuliridis TaxID=452529 RepID=A0ACD4ZU06_9ACTN|nr:phosphotriesterase [Streptomyces scopuliridis]WSB37253.1 phosphotriesterase [Streptomyces scopuliridis]WSC01874.1 phosphotriesterase [Streptomyces scopuliridis]WSC04589.1 phosphotriesterase [Streptomyces scopuliridis]